MPCDQVRTTTLKVEAANIDVLADALRVLGLNVVQVNYERRHITLGNGEWSAGRLKLRSAGAEYITEQEVAKEYGRQSVISTAKRQGWQLRFAANGDIEATRRRFT